MAVDIERTGKLCAILARRFPDAAPHLLARAVVKAQRAGRSAKAAEERACNVSFPSDEAAEAFQLSLKRKAARTLAMLAEACAGPDQPPAEGLSVTMGGDCRGPCAWLRVRGTDGEWMQGDGWDSEAGFPLY